MLKRLTRMTAQIAKLYQKTVVSDIREYEMVWLIPAKAGLN